MVRADPKTVDHLHVALADSEIASISIAQMLALRHLLKRFTDLAPFIPPFMSRICSGYGPVWTGL